ncbi:hypothetical protein ES332_A12G313600v1 [Gossypium tomentosum]|uniref:Uncharacterized protein n=1 Tax=Gossypium tomentosum TaxID=34277 RepID=A0A5D2N3R1_GOSTO|nr:hypothetical protein ES332_A12G313600v1 [Gossypium tomentosum]
MKPWITFELSTKSMNAPLVSSTSLDEPSISILAITLFGILVNSCSKHLMSIWTRSWIFLNKLIILTLITISYVVLDAGQFSKRYGMAQCTKDISRTDCNNFLDA